MAKVGRPKKENMQADQPTSYALCKMLPWYVFPRNGDGLPTDKALRKMMVRVVTRGIADDMKTTIATDTGRALTLLSKSIMRKGVDGKFHAITSGEMVDEAIWFSYHTYLDAVVSSWRMQWIKENDTEALLTHRDEEFYPEALSTLGMMLSAECRRRNSVSETASATVTTDVSRAELIALAIDDMWGDRMRSVAPRFYRAPMVNWSLTEMLASLNTVVVIANS